MLFVSPRREKRGLGVTILCVCVCVCVSVDYWVCLIYTASAAPHSHESGENGGSTHPEGATVQISNIKVFDQSRLGSSLLGRLRERLNPYV